MLRKRQMISMIAVLLIVGMLFGCTDLENTGAEEKTTDAVKNVDVLVIGGGAAGLAAAIEAVDNGASVMLLEKMPMLGGSTLISAGIMYGAETPVQKRLGIDEKWEDLAQYWIDMAEGNVDIEFINYIAEHSGETFGWLEEQGVEFSDDIAPQGVSPALRGHTPKEGKGFGLIQPLEKTAREKGVEILLNTPAKKLIVNDKNDVVGAEAEHEGEKLVINAKAVILTTGGYDVNPDLIAQYAPMANGHISFSARGNVGDGLIMARDAGADIVSKNGVIGFKGVAAEYPYTTPLGGLVFLPGLYVNPLGDRFVNEIIHYAVVHDVLAENSFNEFYIILDKNGPAEVLETGLEEKYSFKGETIEELALSMGIPADKLIKTVDRYNTLAKNGEDSDFGKPAALLAPIEAGPYYALKVSQAMIGSFGGPRVSLEGRVLNTSGDVIKGLFAAGEVANGQLYNQVYPASGTSIAMSFSLGRLAGRNAALEIK